MPPFPLPVERPRHPAGGYPVEPTPIRHFSGPGLSGARTHQFYREDGRYMTSISRERGSDVWYLEAWVFGFSDAVVERLVTTQRHAATARALYWACR